jgi:hypothetical protein
MMGDQPLSNCSISLHRTVLSWLSRRAGNASVLIMAGVRPSLLRFLQTEFQSDCGIFGAKNVRRSHFARFGLRGLYLPDTCGLQRYLSHLFKGGAGSNLPMVCYLSSTHS